MTANRLYWLSVASVVAVVGALAVRSAAGESQTFDEATHISAGYAYVTRGDFSWNMEHPPLAKILCALPLLFMRLEGPLGMEGWKRHDQDQWAADFLYKNRLPADTILMSARCMTILLTLLFAGAVACWTRHRFGVAAGLLAMVLCAFDPNLLAHGRYVTTDVPVTAFYFFACVLWAEYLQNGRFRDLIVAAFVIALAMVAKYSAVLLIPTLLVLYVMRWAQRPKEFPWRRMAVAAFTVAVVSVVVVAVVYWPETLRCLLGRTPAMKNLENSPSNALNLLHRAARSIHLPTHAYFEGLYAVASHNAEGHPSYLMGLRSRMGWWYYFPIAFAVKSTLAGLCSAALLLVAGLTRLIPGPRRFREVPFLWIALIIPPLFYFAFSMTARIDIGIRHLLPIYPFLYVAVAGALPRLSFRKAARYAIVTLGALQVVECAGIAPDYLAFFNALAGGPGNGPHYLADSNIDWGQDVKKLVNWLDAHGTRRVWIAYFGQAPLRYYGVDQELFPGPLDRQGWDAIDGYAVASVTALCGVYQPLANLAPLRLRRPIAKVGWSLYVYDFSKPKEK